ncbi:MAG: SAM-dependent chlorinase/fluorinase [Phaeodactylibacter sp.]|nr:SAM-dependent chlorinase/fluorinase [Phaeodactylibacter sp.]
MAIVTLTTDFGDQGFDLPKLKGALLSSAPTAQLVDLTHRVENYDIVQAAFLLRNAWRSFPKGTIHLISVNDYPSDQPGFLAAAHRGHYFIAPDNGLFSLIFPEDAPNQYHEVPYELHELMSLERIYARAVGHLAQGRPIIELGKATTEVEQRITLQPVISPSLIRGSVIFVDSFDNAITNINRALFEQIGGGRSFQLFFKRNDPIARLSKHYHEVEIGEALCLFNSSNLLEVAINMGKASSLLGINVEDTIQIEFHS